MKDMISLENVSLQFGDGFALKGLTFRVLEGEIFGFLGPSGAGKTTTIKLLTKQLRRREGNIHILGKDIDETEHQDYNAIGILSDTSALYERLTIEENLRFYARIRQISDDRIEEMLKRIGLFEQRKTMIKKCSRGMKQRAVLAASMMHRPRLLFLDEPTGGLDPASRQDIHRLLQELNREGTTIFLTTHDMEEADRLCGRIGIIDDGCLAAIGTPEELKIRYAKDTIKIQTAEGEMLEVKKDPAGAEKIRAIIAEGRCVTIHSQEPGMEELFLQLTGRAFE